MKSPRIDWIDVLRGMGIVLVVLGHCSVGLASSIIYAFHMPLFFVLGGLLYRPSQDYKAFLSHKATHLLIPYLTFLCILYSETLIKSIRYAFVSPGLSSIKGVAITLAKGLYGGEYLIDGTSTFWFITCFFMTQQMFNYLFTKIKPKMLSLILACSLVISYIDSYFFRHLVFPGAVNVVLAALPYFGLGVYLKGRSLPKFIYIMSGFITLLGLWLIGRGYPLAYSMKFSDYGVPLLSFGVASAAVILMIGLSQLLSKVDRFKQVLTYIGSASMVILYMHQFVQMQIKIRIGEDAIWLRFGASLLISLVVYQLIIQYPLTRAFCLGSVKDIQMLFQDRSKAPS